MLKNAISILTTLALVCIISVASQSNETKTLTLRTNEGIVVVESDIKNIDDLSAVLSSTKDLPSSSSGIVKWLIGYGLKMDEMRIYFSDHIETFPIPSIVWEKTTVNKAIASGKIPNIKDIPLYEAYLLIRMAGGEAYFLSDRDDKTNYNFADFPHTLFIFSSAPGNGTHGIFLDGTNLSKNKAGYNFVAFSPDGKTVAEVGGFALYEDSSESQKMFEFLERQPEGAYIAGSIMIGPGVFLTQDSLEAMRKYGSDANIDPQMRSSHAMFGRKGWPPGTAIESTADNVGTDIEIFDSKLFINETDLNNLAENYSGKLVVLEGTAGDNAVFIYNP